MSQKIRDLKIKTFEGLSVKNYQTFPSREWGDNGGMQADVYLDGKLAGTAFDAGDGGMGEFTFSKGVDINKFNDACLKFLRRVDKDYRKSKLMPKQAKDVNEDDYVMVVDLIACFYTGKPRVL